MRPRVELLVVVLLFAVVSGTALVSSAMAGNEGAQVTHADWQEPTRPPSVPEPETPPPAAALAPSPESVIDLTAKVSVEIEGFLGWAAIDRRTGEIAFGGDDEVSTTESMIKVWLAADYLRRATEAGTVPDHAMLEQVRLAVRDSDDGAAEVLYRDGGHNEVVERMIELCALTDTEIYPFWWSRTEMAALDAARLAECIGDGTAAGPEWTDWLLEEMRQVRGSNAQADQVQEEGYEGGRWGIIDGLPAEYFVGEVAIKNGWTRIGRTNNWHVNCLAVADGWVLAVMMQYPVEYSLDYGAQRCASVAEQLFRTAVLDGNRIRT